MNLVEGIQDQCNRTRELKTAYDAIPTGAFGGAFITAAIKEGEAAIASGDVIRMLSAYKKLESVE